MIIRRAGPEEYVIGFSLLKDAAEWLRRKGVAYWQNWHDPPARHRKWIRDGFDRGEFFFAEDEGAVVGMFRLQDADPMFWGDDGEAALYIHSLTTKRSLAGKGLGRELLMRIEEKAKEKSRKFLRLDCGAEIEKLCAYYEAFGFSFVRRIEADGYVMNLYQKSV